MADDTGMASIDNGTTIVFAQPSGPATAHNLSALTEPIANAVVAAMVIRDEEMTRLRIDLATAQQTIERAREAFDGTTPGASGNSKLDALLQRAAAGQLRFTDDAQNLGRIVAELLNRLARIQAALEADRV